MYFRDLSSEKETWHDGPFYKKEKQDRPFPNGLDEQSGLFCGDLGNTGRRLRGLGRKETEPPPGDSDKCWQGAHSPSPDCQSSKQGIWGHVFRTSWCQGHVRK